MEIKVTKGDLGEKGEKGEETQQLNWRQCAWKRNESKNSGHIHVDFDYPIVSIMNAYMHLLYYLGMSL